MKPIDDKEKKRSDFWFQASEMLFETQRDAVDENVALKQENEKLRSALECIAELCSEGESLDAVELVKDIHRIAIDVHNDISKKPT